MELASGLAYGVRVLGTWKLVHGAAHLTPYENASALALRDGPRLVVTRCTPYQHRSSTGADTVDAGLTQPAQLTQTMRFFHGANMGMWALRRGTRTETAVTKADQALSVRCVLKLTQTYEDLRRCLFDFDA